MDYVMKSVLWGSGREEAKDIEVIGVRLGKGSWVEN